MTTTESAPKKRIIYKGQVEKIIDYTPDFRELWIQLTDPDEFSFRAGQFLMLHVPTESKPALRAYSIASSDKEKSQLKLIFKFVPKGVASEFVWTLTQNQEIQFTGPFGKVFFKEPASEQIIFLCTGSGVAQHICFIKSHAELLRDKNISFFMGLTSEKDIYFEEELEKVQSEFKNFKYAYVLSQGSANWKGLKGYVQNQISHLNYNKIPTDFYLCGNGTMIKQTKEKLAGEGILATNIVYEAFD